MSPENTHKLMGFYMEDLILGIVHSANPALFAVATVAAIDLHK